LFEPLAPVLNSLLLASFSNFLTTKSFFMKIYIENLHDTIDNENLSETFSPYGEVQSAQVVKDIFTGASGGFGYVEMDDAAAQNAIKTLNQTALNDLKITVKEAPAVNEQKGSYKVGTGTVNVYRFRKN